MTQTGLSRYTPAAGDDHHDFAHTRLNRRENGSLTMLSIHLLGKPRVERDRVPAPAPKGRKAWALLAYLIRSEVAPSRERLAGLLFADADDPLGAVRWNLAQLRRLLGDSETLRGDPTLLSLAPGTFIDVRAMVTGTWVEAVKVPGLGRDLLEGMNFPSCPAFEAWLLSERRHLAACSADVLREAVVSRLASRNEKGAIADATKLVEMDPLDESSQSLLIRAYSASGDREAALNQLNSCRKLFRRELGVDPGPSVAAALDVPSGSPMFAAIGGRAAAQAQLDAGRAAIGAGAIEPGLDCLRRAAAEAQEYGDLELKGQALVDLGTALVHSARGRGEEGVAVLHEAIATAARTGQSSLTASAQREIGYVEMKLGRYERAEWWVGQALALATDDPSERAAALGILGICLTDTANYAEAIESLDASVRLAGPIKDRKQVAYSLSFLGRAHLLRGDIDSAESALKEALCVAQEEGWAAFLPHPESFLADVDLLHGRTEAAQEKFEHAFALGCQLEDACWEGLGARGIGLMKALTGEVDAAVEWLTDAQTRCTRLADAHLWIPAYCLDALCAVAVEHDVQSATKWTEDLESLAGRTGMRELVARAYLHRHHLGDRTALGTARILAADIDNPALQQLLGDPSTGARRSQQVVFNE